MDKRVRPTTYAEAIEAKKFAHKISEEPIVETKHEIVHDRTTLNGVQVKELPSGGTLYGKGAEIFFTPLSFGDMKFLAGSTLTNKESLIFFLSKIQTSFDKMDLTYFDFHYITVLIKLSTFGESNFKIMFECPKCKKDSESSFNTGDLVFEDLKVELPAIVTSKFGNDYKFSPMKVGKYLDIIERDLISDKDVYMANQMIDKKFDEALYIIQNELNGMDVHLIESVDVMFYHGVEDLILKCSNKIKGDNDVEEVCGYSSAMPFFSLPNFVSPVDTNKKSFGDRIRYGV